MLFGRHEGEATRPWAVALLRPRSSAKPGALVEVLEDGAVLHRTLLSYVPITIDGLVARAWLATLGEDVPALHGDPRGVLFFPDVLQIRGRTYADVVGEVGYAGVWVAAGPLSEDEQLRFAAFPRGRAPSASRRFGSS